MIYYIDGYNFIFSLDLEAPEQIAQGHPEALERLYNRIKFHHLTLVLVFDAYQNTGEVSRIDYKDIEIVYTAYGQKADDYLIDVVKLSNKPSQITVVTNDKGLTREVKFLNGRVMKISEFLSLRSKKIPVEDEKSSTCLFDKDDFEYYQKSFEKDPPKKRK